MNSTKLLAAAAAIVAVSGSAVAQCSNYSLSPAGTVILDVDDGIVNVGLPFDFPFNGNLYHSITVSSNGWIKLGQATATSSQLTESESLMLSDDPRIAVCWDDLNAGPSGSGDVFYAADASQASVTWQGVQRFGASQVGTLANCECILLPSGEIFLNYDATCTFNLSNSQSLVGISAGGNSVAPGISLVDWSLANPGPINVVNATAYEIFPVGAFDLLGGVVLHFLPTGVDTYGVVQVPALGACAQLPSYPGFAVGPTNIGVGCPTPIPNSSIYELFTTDAGASPLDTQNTSIRFAASGENYTAMPGPGFDPNYTSGTMLTLGDEQVVSLPVGAMTAFPFGDLLVTSIGLSSNGFLWLDGTTTNDFSPTAAEFNNLGARIAGCWKDLNPSVGGTIWFDDTNANFCMVTFDQVPEFGNPALCTFQVKLWNNGDADISHGAVASGTDNVLVGLTRGAANDPGSSDLVTGGVVNTIGPVDIVGQNAMTHASTKLALGKPWDLQASVSNHLGLGLFIVGTSNPNIPLDGLGAIGCTSYASLDFIFPELIFGSSFTYSFGNFPYVPSATGAVLYTQAAAFSTANAFGFVLSNGLEHTFGL